MDKKEMKTKNIKELNQMLSDSRDKLRELRFKDANKQLKNVREIRLVKKTIAGIITFINQARNNKQQQ